MGMMQASAQGNALSGPVLREEEAEPAVRPARVRCGMGMCWDVSAQGLEQERGVTAAAAGSWG